MSVPPHSSVPNASHLTDSPWWIPPARSSTEGAGGGPPVLQAALRLGALGGEGALPGRKRLRGVSVHAPTMAPSPAVLTRLLCAGERSGPLRREGPWDPREEDRDVVRARSHRLSPRRCVALAKFIAEGDPGPGGAKW